MEFHPMTSLTEPFYCEEDNAVRPSARNAPSQILWCIIMGVCMCLRFSGCSGSFYMMEN